jgi:hypothetical protein
MDEFCKCCVCQEVLLTSSETANENPHQLAVIPVFFQSSKEFHAQIFVFIFQDQSKEKVKFITYGFFDILLLDIVCVCVCVCVLVGVCIYIYFSIYRRTRRFP